MQTFCVFARIRKKCSAKLGGTCRVGDTSFRHVDVSLPLIGCYVVVTLDKMYSPFWIMYFNGELLVSKVEIFQLLPSKILKME